MVGNDVDSRDVGYGVHGQVVVGDVAGLGEWEVFSVAKLMCQMPYEAYECAGIAAREAFHGKASATAAHHVEVDAVACLVANGEGLLSPALGAETPEIVVGTALGPFGCALVFGVEAYEIHAIAQAGSSYGACHL